MADEITVEIIEPPDITVEVIEAPDITVEVTAGVPGAAGPPGTIVAVGPTPPINPVVGDLWVDTSS